MSLYSSYQTDTTVENDGRWVNTFRDGIELKLRSTASKPARDAQRKIDKRNRRFLMAGDTVPAEIQDQNEAEMACAVVVDWKNVTDADDQPIICTDATKRQIFSDASLREFRQQVIGAAHTADNFRKAEQAADMGNSPNPSAPSSAVGTSAS